MKWTASFGRRLQSSGSTLGRLLPSLGHDQQRKRYAKYYRFPMSLVDVPGQLRKRQETKGSFRMSRCQKSRVDQVCAWEIWRKSSNFAAEKEVGIDLLAKSIC